MTTFADQASKAHQNHQEAMSKARSFADPNLSAEALQRKRAELVTAEQDRYARERATIEADAKDRHATAGRAAGEARPKITDHAHVAARWAQLKPLLDSGRTVREVLAKTDVVGVQAIQDYAPSYFEAKAGRPGIGQEPVALPNIVRLADDRLIELDPDAAKYIKSERETRADRDRALVYTQPTPGESDLALAVKAHMTGSDDV